jgi:hypothetical protein
MTTDERWVPEACTLPTAERPVRSAEFDDLFATALRRQERSSATALRWWLDRSAEGTARELARRESSCCSFFSFSFSAAGDELQMDLEVPEPSVAVLDALAARATAAMRS